MTSPASSAHVALSHAIGEARAMMERVLGPTSVFEQMETGEWGEDLSPEAAADLADLVLALAEQARHTRAMAAAVNQGEAAMHNARASVSALVTSGLPLNRKERFYTGTVLPMLVAGDGFAHLDRLLSLCGLPSAELTGNSLEGLHPVAFFTEYSFVESCFTTADRQRFPSSPTDADTPDVVIAGDDWLLCIEAKMFHNPDGEALNAQMRRQKVLVDYWVQHLPLNRAKVAHVLLLPERLSTSGVTFPVVTWEQVLRAYSTVGPRYWAAMLWTALERYDELVSVADTYGLNAEARLSGLQLRDAAERGALLYGYMGRSGGLDGPNLAEDLSTDRWKKQLYEVRTTPLPGNRNWFEVSSFLARLTAD